MKLVLEKTRIVVRQLLKEKGSEKDCSEEKSQKKVAPKESEKVPLKSAFEIQCDRMTPEQRRCLEEKINFHKNMNSSELEDEILSTISIIKKRFLQNQ